MSRNRREEIALNLFFGAFIAVPVSLVTCFFYSLYGG